MGDNGWLPVIGFIVLVNPIIVITGIASGLVARRWWQVVLGLVTAPAACWVYDTVFGKTNTFASPLLLVPFLALAGIIWTAAVFGLKKAAFD